LKINNETFSWFLTLFARCAECLMFVGPYGLYTADMTLYSGIEMKMTRH